MNSNKIATKSKALFFTSGSSIDANYGPWDSITLYEEFLHEDLGLSNPYKHTKIGVEDSETGVLTEFIYENDEWKTYIDFSSVNADMLDITARVLALEGDKNAALANQITSSVIVSPSRYYKGTTVAVTATGKISLPSGIPTSKISAISITGGGKTDSGSNKTQVQVSGISTSGNTSNISFSLTGTVDAPFTKSISTPGTCTACNPVYLAVVSNSVNTKEEAFAEVAKTTNLVYTSNLAVTSMKGYSKSLTFINGDRIAVICGDSGLKARGAGMLADYNWVVNGESVTDNGVTYKVYVSGALQAETRTINFS